MAKVIDLDVYRAWLESDRSMTFAEYVPHYHAAIAEAVAQGELDASEVEGS
jgi:hypothetical protein